MKQTQIVLLAALISMAATSGAAAMNQPPGSVFSDCPACPEMVVVAAGSFTMGSSPAGQQWAATHGGTLKSVADESPDTFATQWQIRIERS